MKTLLPQIADISILDDNNDSIVENTLFHADDGDGKLVGTNYRQQSFFLSEHNSYKWNFFQVSYVSGESLNIS